MIRQVLHAQLALTNSRRLGRKAKATPQDLMGGLQVSSSSDEATADSQPEPPTRPDR